MKKKIATAVLSAIIAASLAACGSSAGTSAASAQDSSTRDALTQDASALQTGADTGTPATETASAQGDSKALIIYFDYSENMGDTSGMDADAITSTSLAGATIDGVTRNDLLVMKDEIQKQTGADVYSVQVTDPYDPDYNTMVGVAQDDQEENKQFSFKEELPDLDGYDTVYIGMPVWWGGLPQPMASFLDQHDIVGKTIIPFGINLGSGFGRMVEQIQEAEPESTVSEDGLTENSHTPNDEVVSDVDEWLSSLS